MAIENPFKNLSKPQIYAIIAGGVAIGGYAEYRHHKATGNWSPFATGNTNTASTNGTAESGNDPITGMPYSDDNAIDPETDLTYLAEADQYGSVASAEAAVSAFGQSTASGSGIPVNPASPVSTGSVNTVQGTTVYTSNAAWSQAVQAGLEDVSGSSSYDGTDIGTALGAYLQGEPLTAAQAQVIGVAIAEYGAPPTGNLQITLIPSSSPSSTTSTNTAPAVSGGHVISSSPTGGVVGWTGANAAYYEVTITGPGKINGQTNKVTIQQATYEGLESGHNYTVKVVPYSTSGVAGAPGNIELETPPAPTAK